VGGREKGERYVIKGRYGGRGSLRNEWRGVKVRGEWVAGGRNMELCNRGRG